MTFYRSHQQVQPRIVLFDIWHLDSPALWLVIAPLLRVFQPTHAVLRRVAIHKWAILVWHPDTMANHPTNGGYIQATAGA